MQNCPHCSTGMEDYATICPGCGAEKILTSPEGSFRWKKAIISIIILEVFFIPLLIYKFEIESGWGIFLFILVGLICGLGFGAGKEAYYEWRR